MAALILLLGLSDARGVAGNVRPQPGHALSDGSTGRSGVEGLGFGALGPGLPFYMLGPHLINLSAEPLVIDSVAARPEREGAINSGWHLLKVPASGAPTAFCPQIDADSARFLAETEDVTKADNVLAPHSAAPFDVLLYLEFKLHAHTANKVSRVLVTYTQEGRQFEQSFKLAYRFQTPDMSPLP